MQEDHLPQTQKKRAVSVTATSVETDPSHGILDEPAERLGNFHDSARTLAFCLQKHDVSRKTDQRMIEAARWMFHILLGEARNDLDRLTPRSQEGLSTEIKQSKQRHAHTVILKENPGSRPEEPSEKSVLETSTETPLPQSSAEILDQVNEDDPRKQLELSVPQYEPGEWKHEFKMSSFTATILNLLFTEAEKKGKIRNFQIHIGTRIRWFTHPLDPEDPDLLKQYAFLSCAKICVDDSRFSPDLHKDRRVTLNKKQKNEISDSTAYITEIHQTMCSLLTNTIPYSRTIMYMVTPATEASNDGSWTFFQYI